MGDGTTVVQIYQRTSRMEKTAAPLDVAVD
jgi:hypothetical protein